MGLIVAEAREFFSPGQSFATAENGEIQGSFELGTVSD